MFWSVRLSYSCRTVKRIQLPFRHLNEAVLVSRACVQEIHSSQWDMWRVEYLRISLWFIYIFKWKWTFRTIRLLILVSNQELLSSWLLLTICLLNCNSKDHSMLLHTHTKKLVRFLTWFRQELGIQTVFPYLKFINSMLITFIWV